MRDGLTEAGDIIITNNEYNTIFVYRIKEGGQRTHGNDTEILAMSGTLRRKRSLWAHGNPDSSVWARAFTPRKVEQGSATSFQEWMGRIGITLPSGSKVYYLNRYGYKYLGMVA